MLYAAVGQVSSKLGLGASPSAKSVELEPRAGLRFADM